MAKLFKIALLFLVACQLNAQEVLPFVENFSKSEYRGDNQIWNVVQGNDNAMYFANNHYFLRYNGVKWEAYTLPNKTIIRSIFVDGERIYCGSYKEFGYWTRESGKMRYRSLSKSNPKLFTGNSDNEEIWKIFKYQGKIYFQSFNELFIYDAGSTYKLRFPSQISYCYLVDHTLYAASVTNGVYEMRDNQFIRKENWDILKQNVIHYIGKHQGKIYVFTKNNGIFIEENGRLVSWQHPLNEIVKEQVLITAKFVDEKTLAIGTGLKGLYILNLADQSYQNINRENALKNNAILSIGVDRENDLWLGLDNGICHIEINSPVSIFSDNSGILGSVYSLSTIDDGYLFVTNHGIFTYLNKNLTVVPDSQGQVWDIYKSDGQFIIGHNDGTFLYDGAKLHRVNPVNGGWKFLNSRFDKVYFQANYSGIAVYPDKNNLTKWKILGGLTKPIRNIAQNKPNELWAADNYKSLYRIEYNDHFETTKIENVSQQNGIRNNFGVKLFSYKNRVLFLIKNDWYVYDAAAKKLVIDLVFNKAFRNISDIIPIDDENFMVIKNNLLYLISQQGEHFIWQLISEKYYQGKIILENTNVYKDGKRLLINLDDGFLSFEWHNRKQIRPNVKIEAFYNDQLITSKLVADYNQSIEVHFICEYYGYNRPDLFYKLNDAKPFTSIKTGLLVLNNLTAGKQKLDVFYHNGKEYIKLSTYVFEVGNPWYFSFWMILLYILIVVLICFLYYRWNKIRYDQKLKLREEELRHQKNILEIKLNADNELKIQAYEKHILELEIQSKSSEVAGKSFSIAKQSEIIDSINKVLDNENDINRLKAEIKKSIRANAINKHEWETFETNMKQIHNEFISRLIKKFPDLTSKDIKLSIYLKMNLSSKEIAPLMNISFRGVELHRYRLRKKLGISQDENLNKFMLDL